MSTQVVRAYVSHPSYEKISFIGEKIMPIIRTPDDRFANLDHYPFAPNYADINGVRVHYVDEGKGSNTIFCLHGEPTWSYLYRHMIPPLAKQHRVIAPDLIGFGKSDKFTEMSEYSLELQVTAMTKLIEHLNLTNITLVCQDWGGIVGLPLATQLDSRFSRLVILNTALPTGDRPMTDGFRQWREFVERTGRDLIASQVIEFSTINKELLTPEVLRAYDAPFPSPDYATAIAVYPLLVPTKDDDAGVPILREARDRLANWHKPALVMFSDMDVVLGGGDRFFRKHIPSAKDQPVITIEGAGHFLQEEKGAEIAGHILDFLART